MFNKVFPKIFGIFSLGLILIVLMMGWYGTKTLKKDHIENTKDLLIKNLIQLDKSFFDISWAVEDPDRFCKQYGKAISARITIIRKDGFVLGDSQADPTHMDNHRFRPEIVESEQAELGSSLRFSDTIKKEMLYVSKPLKTVGYMRLAVPLRTLKESFGGVFQTLIFVLIIGGIFVLFLGYKTTKWITTPVEKMTAFSEKITQGDFDSSLPVTSSDELGMLSKSLNQMKNQLNITITNLTQKKEQLSAILDGIYDGVIAVNRYKEILLYNERFIQEFNLDNTELKQKKLFEVVRNPEINELIENTLTQNKVYQKQIKIIENKVRYFEIIVSPIHSKAKEVIGAVSILHDITYLKSVEQMRVDFVANVSHEFKTPLTSIRGYTDTLLKEGFSNQEESKKFVSTIQSNVKRLSALVEDLLTLSNLESQSKVNKEKIELKEIIENSVNHLKNNADQKHISISSHIEVSSIFADPMYLEQALINLIDNAIKYTRENGKIDVFATACEIENKPGVKITVRDTGPGIASQHLTRIFERFYRVDKGRDRKIGGTGLGLAIVKHVALLHQGQVDVESKSGKGSSFTVHLPLS